MAARRSPRRARLQRAFTFHLRTMAHASQYAPALALTSAKPRDPRSTDPSRGKMHADGEVADIPPVFGIAGNAGDRFTGQGVSSAAGGAGPSLLDRAPPRAHARIVSRLVLLAGWNPMSSRGHIAWLALLLFADTTALSAQDGYAESVGVAGGDVLVMKTDFGQGPASVYVYRVGPDGVWRVADRLSSADGAATGDSFSPSLTLSGELLLVGAGDPDGRWGAHAFRKGAGGEWGRAEEGVSLAEPGGGEWNLAALRRILQPPSRAVASDRNRALVSVLGGLSRMAGVRVFERAEGSESWTEAARLERTDPEANDRFGAALALAGDVALVGAPGHGESGAVYAFVRSSEAGEWRQESVLSASDVAADERFGTALAFDGAVWLVGAPGTPQSSGSVRAFSRDPATGSWTDEGTLSSGARSAGDLFGSSLAVSGNELLIGAPGARDGTGSVHRFVRDSSGAAWRSGGVLSATGAAPGFGLGRVVALAGDVAAAGAPGAAFGRGRAAAYARTEDGGWSEPDWLGLSSDLSLIAGEEVECSEGRAVRFECSEVDLLAFLPLTELGLRPGAGGPLGGVSDVWGWTDPPDPAGVRAGGASGRRWHRRHHESHCSHLSGRGARRRGLGPGPEGVRRSPLLYRKRGDGDAGVRPEAGPRCRRSASRMGGRRALRRDCRRAQSGDRHRERLRVSGRCVGWGRHLWRRPPHDRHPDPPRAHLRRLLH